MICTQVLTEVYGQRTLPLPEHVGVSLVLHCIVDQRQEVRLFCLHLVSMRIGRRKSQHNTCARGTAAFLGVPLVLNRSCRPAAAALLTGHGTHSRACVCKEHLHEAPELGAGPPALRRS